VNRLFLFLGLLLVPAIAACGKPREQHRQPGAPDRAITGDVTGNHSPGEPDRDSHSDEAQAPSGHEFGETLGRSLGRLARSARMAARSAQPEAERLAHQALDAAETALPHVKRASQEAAARAGQFVRENHDEIRRVTATGANIAANHSAPLLRPVIFGVAAEITRQAASWAQASQEPQSATPPEEQGPEPGPAGAKQKDVNLY